MNVNPLRSITGQFGRLSIGVSRTSIRLASNNKSSKTKQKKRQPGEPEPIDVDHPGHGEKIFIFTHMLNGLTVYSLTPVLKAFKALAQIPFVGKKLKPSKIRKDFWKELAIIQFPEGQGKVGRRVYHLLRELRTRHMLEWDNSYFYEEETGKSCTKRQRGEKLNNQKANAIADMAAVLGGAGKSNIVVVKETSLISEETESGAEGRELLELESGEKEDVDRDNVEDEVVETQEFGTEAFGEKVVEYGTTTQQIMDEEGKVEGTRELMNVNVFWANDRDQNYAQEWSPNVSHYLIKGSVVASRESDPAEQVENSVQKEGPEQGQKPEEPEDGQSKT